MSKDYLAIPAFVLGLAMSMALRAAPCPPSVDGGTLAYYALDGLEDSGPNGWDLFQFGSVSFGASPNAHDGPGLSAGPFGSYDFLQAPPALGAALSSSAQATVEAYVYVGSLAPAEQRFWTAGHGGTYLAVLADGSLLFSNGPDDLPAYRVQTPSNALQAGRWHHVAAVLDGVNRSLYVDNALSAFAPDPGGLYGALSHRVGVGPDLASNTAQQLQLRHLRFSGIARSCFDVGGLPASGSPASTSTPTLTATVTPSLPLPACPLPLLTATPALGQMKAGDLALLVGYGSKVFGFDPVAQSFYPWSVGQVPAAITGLCRDPVASGGFLATLADQSVVRLGALGQSLGAYASFPALTPGNAPENPLAYAPDGAVYAFGPAQGSLFRIPPGGGAAQLAWQQASYWPVAGALDHTGRLYISLVTSGQLLRLDLAADPLSPTAVTVAGGLPQIGPLVFDGWRYIYAAAINPSPQVGYLLRCDTTNDTCVTLLDSFGPLAENAGGALYPAYGIAMDAQGYLWLSLSLSLRRGLLKVQPVTGEPLAFVPLPAVVGGVTVADNEASRGLFSLGAGLPRGCGPGPSSSPTAVAPPAKATGTVVAYPNPVRGGFLSLAFDMNEPGEALADIWTARGDPAGSVSAQFSAAGPASLRVDTAGLAPGVYYYVVRLRLSSGREEGLRPGKFLRVRP